MMLVIDLLYNAITFMYYVHIYGAFYALMFTVMVHYWGLYLSVVIISLCLIGIKFDGLFCACNVQNKIIRIMIILSCTNTYQTFEN